MTLTGVKHNIASDQFKRAQHRIWPQPTMPPTYVCVDEADVLRDEGEAHAAKLRSAGVPVTTVRRARLGTT